jgi:hypothetical protein
MLGQFVSHFSPLTQGLREGEAGARLALITVGRPQCLQNLTTSCKPFATWALPFVINLSIHEGRESGWAPGHPDVY